MLVQEVSVVVLQFELVFVEFELLYLLVHLLHLCVESLYYLLVFALKHHVILERIYVMNFPHQSRVNLYFNQIEEELLSVASFIEDFLVV